MWRPLCIGTVVPRPSRKLTRTQAAASSHVLKSHKGWVKAISEEQIKLAECPGTSNIQLRERSRAIRHGLSPCASSLSDLGEGFFQFG
jgi:hypothetical protein